MATVVIPQRGETIRGESEVAAFLAGFGIDHGHWDLSPVPRALLEKPALSPDEKQQILDALEAPIEDARRHAGYQSADVVALSPAISNLDEILKPFAREHYHTENEIRLCVDGAGVFSINPRTAPVFEVHMTPGDFISVPAGTWHWFNLGPERRIKAVRIFESQDGWAAIYPEQAA